MKNSTQESFYLMLAEISLDEQLRRRILPVLGEHFEKTFKEVEEVDYPAIYRIVRDSSLVLEEVELLLQVLITIEGEVSADGHKRAAQKMRRHFQLSYEQKSSFDLLDEKFRSDLDKSEEELMAVQSHLLEVQDELSDAQLMIETINNESSKIYAQFVTILGVFTAIVLSVFGGLQVITTAFENLHAIPIWKSVLIGSIVSIAVLSMLFLLTRWITTIVNKSFGHEGERSLMQIVTNNGAFATGIFIFCYLIIASVIFSSSTATAKLKELINVWDALPVLLLLALPILGGAAVFIKTIDLRKYK